MLVLDWRQRVFRAFFALRTRPGTIRSRRAPARQRREKFQTARATSTENDVRDRFVPIVARTSVRNIEFLQNGCALLELFGVETGKRNADDGWLLFRHHFGNTSILASFGRRRVIPRSVCFLRGLLLLLGRIFIDVFLQRKLERFALLLCRRRANPNRLVFSFSSHAVPESFPELALKLEALHLHLHLRQRLL